MSYFLARLREPSTLAGLAVLAAHIMPALAGGPTAIAVAVLGGLAAVFPDPAREP